MIQEAAFISGSSVCTAEAQSEEGYVCLRASGSQYHGTPLPDEAGNLRRGFTLATTRLAVGALVPAGGWSAGLRFGWALAGKGPQPNGGDAYLPVLGEGQLAYWFSGEALSTERIGVFALASAGVAQVDGMARVVVREDPNAAPPAAQLDNPPVQELAAYQRAGPGFAGAGLGVFAPLGDAKGLIADARAIALFPSTGSALSLSVGVAWGL